MALAEYERLKWPETDTGSQTDPATLVEESFSSFMTENGTVQGQAERLPLALSFVTQLRKALTSETSAVTEMSPTGVRPRTKVDVAEWMARRDEWFRLQGYFGKPEDKMKARFAKIREFKVRNRVFRDIMLYDRLSGSSPEAYQDLLDIFHQSRLLVRNPQAMLANQSGIDKGLLGNMLKTYKLISGLDGAGVAAKGPVFGGLRDNSDAAVAGTDLMIDIQPGPSQSASINSDRFNNKVLVYMPDRFGEDFEPLTARDLEPVLLSLSLQTGVD